MAIQPNNLTELPQAELDFLKELPTTWDETRFIDGYPGKYVVLARRHGEQWYIAGLNAQEKPLQLSLDLTQYSGMSQIISDIVDKKTKTVSTVNFPLKKNKKGVVKAEIQPRGGIIIY